MDLPSLLDGKMCTWLFALLISYVQVDVTLLSIYLCMYVCMYV